MSDIPRDPPGDGGEGDDLERQNVVQDAEGEDDDLGLEEPGDDEAGHEEEGDQEEVAERRPTRARDTITSLRRRAQEAERREQDYQRRLEALERGQQRSPQVDQDAQRRQEEAFNAEIDQMIQNGDFRGAMRKVEDRANGNVRAALGQMYGSLRDERDMERWEEKVASDRTAARLAPRVEAMVQEARRAGNYSTTRLMAFRYLLGEEVDRQRAERGNQQRGQAARRLARQTVRPGSGRGDFAPSRGRRTQDEDDEELLRNTPVGNFGV